MHSVLHSPYLKMPQPCSLGHSAAKSPAQALLPVIAKHGHSAVPAAAAQPECWSPAWPARLRRETAPGLLTPPAVSFAADSVTEVPQRGRTASREARRERTQRRQQYAERLSHGGKREQALTDTDQGGEIECCSGEEEEEERVQPEPVCKVEGDSDQRTEMHTSLPQIWGEESLRAMRSSRKPAMTAATTRQGQGRDQPRERPIPLRPSHTMLTMYSNANTRHFTSPAADTSPERLKRLNDLAEPTSRRATAKQREHVGPHKLAKLLASACGVYTNNAAKMPVLRSEPVKELVSVGSADPKTGEHDDRDGARWPVFLLKRCEFSNAVLQSHREHWLKASADRQVRVTRTHTHLQTHARTQAHTHARTHTHTHTHTHSHTHRMARAEKERAHQMRQLRLVRLLQASVRRAALRAEHLAIAAAMRDMRRWLQRRKVRLAYMAQRVLRWSRGWVRVAAALARGARARRDAQRLIQAVARRRCCSGAVSGLRRRWAGGLLLWRAALAGCVRRGQSL